MNITDITINQKLVMFYADKLNSYVGKMKRPKSPDSILQKPTSLLISIRERDVQTKIKK
jgi:hypothetical protein